MPNQTYQPKKFRRSKRRYSRQIRRVFGLLALIALYFAITVSLDRSDDTVRWARVLFPPFVVKDSSCIVRVTYRDLGENAVINAKMLIKYTGGSSLGNLEVKKKIPKGMKPVGDSFAFSPIDPNVTDYNDLFAHVSVSCEDDTGQRPMITGMIPVYPPDHDKVMRYTTLPDYQNVLMDAFRTGFWLEDQGDRTVIGWGITVCYLLAGMLCFYCTGHLDSRRVLPISQIFAWFWCLMAVALVLLGINKQLDVQMLLADIGRAYTKYHGWYGQRAPVQNRVLAVGACLGLACVQGVAYRMKRGPKSLWFALWGLLFLGATVLVHLVSQHDIEHVLALSVAGLSVGSALEILAILWIAVSALVYNHTEREEVSYIMQ